MYTNIDVLLNEYEVIDNNDLIAIEGSLENYNYVYVDEFNRLMNESGVWLADVKKINY